MRKKDMIETCYQIHTIIYTPVRFKQKFKTRSQAVARIADRPASQHLRGTRDVNGHLTIW